MNSDPHRPPEHQRLIEFMQESKSPPADSETPSIPEELLTRLHEHYGTAPEPAAESRRERSIVKHEPSFLSVLVGLLRCPRCAIPVVLLVVIGAGTLCLQRGHRDEETRMRGASKTAVSLTAYWLSADTSQPAPTGLGLPPFTVITALNQLPRQGDILLCDPAHREARLLHDGQIRHLVPIADPHDSEDWLKAHRQLTQRLTRQ